MANLCDSCRYGQIRRRTRGFGLRPWCAVEQVIVILDVKPGCEGYKAAGHEMHADTSSDGRGES